LPEAQRDLEAALKINPRHAPALYNLPMARLAVGKPEEALKLIDEVLARAPRFSKALALRGRILHRQGRWKEAMEEFEGALSTDPALEPHLRAMMDDCRSRLAR
jgi:tetratricopeptide (TPR) repeat protein